VTFVNKHMLPLIVLIFGISFFWASLWWISPQKSASFDEQYHLAAGYSYLKTGDYRIASTHPPLIGLLAAIPLAQTENIHLPLDQSGWQNGDRFIFSEQWLWRSGNNPHQLINNGRLGIMALGTLLITLLGITLYQRGKTMTASAFVWGLVILDPNLHANSRLITTDLGLTALMFFTIMTWQVWRKAESSSIKNALTVLLIAFGGLTATAKYTGLIVWPILFLLTILTVQNFTWSQTLKRGSQIFIMFLASSLLMWGIYRFDIGHAQFGDLEIPLPASFYWTELWNTLIKLPQESEQKLSFLLGSAYTGGVWYYFPVAFAVKIPVTTLFLSAVGLFQLRQEPWQKTIGDWLPILVFVALGLTGILTIGFRHMLPMIPFVFLWVLRGVERVQHWRYGRLLLIGLAVLYLFEIGRVWPHQEAFFNVLAGPPENWSTILVDSNLDWGQDLIHLEQKMGEHGISHINLAYFGTASPEQYGINYTQLPSYIRFSSGFEIQAYNPLMPDPGWYAISETSLRLGLLSPQTAELYKVFQNMEPVDRAGFSIYIYQIPQSTQSASRNPVVVTGEPGYLAALRAENREIFQNAQIKWRANTNSEIIPNEPAQTDPFKITDPMVNFADIFHLIDVQGVPSEARPGDLVTVELVWRVGPQSPAQLSGPAPSLNNPINTFVHLTQSDPYVRIAQYDGWDVALRGLTKGDIIKQTIFLHIADSAEIGLYDLQMGIYSPQTFGRLRTTQDEDQVGIGSIRILAGEN